MNIKFTILFLPIIFFSPYLCDAQIITTVAGGNGAGFSGDGGPATSAAINVARSVALDTAGNIYVCDNVNNRIREINKATGIIHTIAGTGIAGFSGDGGPALSAAINYPQDLCVDPAGNVYFSDFNNFRIRRIDAATGIITTIAGNGGGNYFGGTIPGIAAGISYPGGVEVHGTNLYISIFDRGLICKLDLSTGILTSIAGTGTDGFSGDGGPAIDATFYAPEGLSVTSNGDLYVADFANNRIRKIDAGGIVTTVAGNGIQAFSGDGGPAVAASLYEPSGVFADASGNLFIADRSNYRVRKVAVSTGIISTVAGSGNYGYTGDGGLATSPCTDLSDLWKVTGDAAGNLFIADESNNCIRKVDTSHLVIPTPAVNIAILVTSFCSGAPETFNATPINAGNNPVYQWKVNGNNAGTNNASFTTSVLNNGDHITCELTSNSGCGQSTVTSNAINVSVSASVKPSLVVTPSTVMICSGNDGSTIIFTAMVTNGGALPSFQWRINNKNAGTNSPSFTGNPLIDGDTVSCLLISNANCAVPDSAVSNTIKIIVSPIVTPTAAITSTATDICTGGPVTFHAQATNSGNHPSYQWQVNGINAGANNAVFTTSSLQNADIVTCSVTPDPAFACVAPGIANSNQISISVSASVSPSINILGSANDVCQGTVVKFSATVQNATNPPSYQWQINGDDVGGNSPSYSSDSLSNNDQVTCILAAGSASCQSSPVASGIIVMSVKDSPIISINPSDTIVPAGSQVQLTAIINGSVTSYNWSPSIAFVNPVTLTPLTKPLSQAAILSLTATNAGNCIASQTVTLKIYRPLLMPSAFTPNGDGVNDVFRIPPNVLLTLHDFSIYNRWGGRVFSTSDISTGWNGTFGGAPAPAGTYVYFVSGLSDGKEIFLKGVVILIR